MIKFFIIELGILSLANSKSFSQEYDQIQGLLFNSTRFIEFSGSSDTSDSLYSVIASSDSSDSENTTQNYSYNTDSNDGSTSNSTESNTEGNESATNQTDSSTNETDSSINQTDSNTTNETDSITNQTDSNTNETDSTTNQTNSNTNETDSNTNETDSTTNQTDSNTNETDSNTNETDTNTNKTDSNTNETDSNTNKTDTTTNETDSTTNKTDSNTNETDSTTNQTDSNTNETDSTTNNTDSNNPDSNSSNETNSSNSTSPDDKNNTNNSTDEKITPESIQCRLFKYSDSFNNTCLQELKENEYYLFNCQENYECQAFSFDTNVTTSTCIQKSSSVYKCVSYKGKNDDCTTSAECNQDLYCKNNLCVKKLTEDSSCSSLDDCEKGTICNLDTCIEYFTIESGKPANSNIACKSGIVLNGTCQNEQVTNGTLPKPCETDYNCTATDGVTHGTCVCVNDDKGSSYCKPHRSDPISLDHLKVTHEGNHEEIELSTFKYINYPLLEKANTYYNNSFTELKTLKILENHAEVCANSQKSWFIGSLVLLFIS